MSAVVRDREERARFRALARATHPDAGGTHEAFLAAIDAWEATGASTGDRPAVPGNVRFYRRQTPAQAAIAAFTSTVAAAGRRLRIIRSTQSRRTI